MSNPTRSFVPALYRWAIRRLVIRRNVEHHSSLRVGIGTTIRAPDKITIGRDVEIGAYCAIACNGEIGDGVLISSNVGIVGRYDHDHTVTGTYISNAPWLYSQDARSREKKDKIVIEDDVWVGHGAIILSGIKIGRGSIIAAGAVVIKDVQPYSIVAGNPAKKVSERFNLEEQAEHEKILCVTKGS